MNGAESEFSLGLIAAITREIHGPLNTVQAFAGALKSGEFSEARDGELFVRDVLDVVDGEAKRVRGFHGALEVTVKLALGRYEPFGSVVDTRELADEALQRLQRFDPCREIAVSGVGAPVEVEDEIRQGFLDLAGHLAEKTGARCFTIEVDGAEITLPAGGDEAEWSFLLGDGNPYTWDWAWLLAVRLIRLRGGSVERAGDTLRVRFAELNEEQRRWQQRRDEITR